MPRSTDAADAPAVRGSSHWGSNASGEAYPEAARLKSLGLSANGVDTYAESTEFLAELMEEVPGGPNHGRTALASRDSDQTERHTALGADDAQAREFLADGGWGIVTTKDGTRAGVTAHRGVLVGDEYVDLDVLQAGVERELGFTIDEVKSVYRQGRMTDAQRELRASIDARLLALSRSGANMAALARLLGFAYDERAEQFKTMDRALLRARSAEVTA